MALMNPFPTFTTIPTWSRFPASPLEENQVSSHWCIVWALKLFTLLKQLCSHETFDKFRNNFGINLSALICAPWHKAGTPRLVFIVPIPFPAYFSTAVFFLWQCCFLQIAAPASMDQSAVNASQDSAHYEYRWGSPESFVKYIFVSKDIYCKKNSLWKRHAF